MGFARFFVRPAKAGTPNLSRRAAFPGCRLAGLSSPAGDWKVARTGRIEILPYNCIAHSASVTIKMIIPTYLAVFPHHSARCDGGAGEGI